MGRCHAHHAAIAALFAMVGCELIAGIDEKRVGDSGAGGGAAGAPATGGAGHTGAGGGAPFCAGVVAEGRTRPPDGSWWLPVQSGSADAVARLAVTSNGSLVMGSVRGGLVDIARVTPPGSMLDWAHSDSVGSPKVALSGSRLLVAGTFSEDLVLPPCPMLDLSNSQDDSIFVASLGESEGECTWARAMTSTAPLTARDVAADDGGAAYVVGELGGTVTPQGGCDALSLNNGEVLYLSKWDESGTCEWVRAGAKPSSLAQSATSVAASSAFVVAGGSYDAADDVAVFPGGTALSAFGGLDAFIVSYDASGAHRWSLGFGSSEEDQVNGLAVDAQGNVVAVGHYQTTFELTPGCVIPEPNAQGGFVMKLDADGTLLWARGFGDGAFFDGVAIDGAGDIYVSGSFRYTIDLGAGSLGSNTIDWQVVVLKLSADGHHEWSTSLPSTSGSDFGNAIAVSQAGVFVGGSFQDDIDFGAAIGPQSAPNQDGYVVRLAP